MELTEKLLISLGGWPVLKQARLLHAAGAVQDAFYEPPLLRGRVSTGDKSFSAGLRIRNTVDIENLCPCRDSQVRGLICAHSIAVGLAVLFQNPLHTANAQGTASSSATTTAHASLASTLRHSLSSTSHASQTVCDECPHIELNLEGSLNFLQASIQFRYTQPQLWNPQVEAQVLAELLSYGFENHQGQAALKGEAVILNFFASVLPKLRKKWHVIEGERFQHVTKDFIALEPHLSFQSQEPGWLQCSLHFTAGKSAFFSASDILQLLQQGQGSVTLKNGQRVILNDSLMSDMEAVLHDCNPTQERGHYRMATCYQEYLEHSVEYWKTQNAAQPIETQGRSETQIPERSSKRSCASESPSSHPLLPPFLGSLHTCLRPYQIEGAQWLIKQAQKGLGGLLADEMGLGKTLQALALIEVLTQSCSSSNLTSLSSSKIASSPSTSLKDSPQKPAPALVVCPSSLVWNWKREAERFLPNLKVLAIEGSGSQRLSRLAEISKYDLILTSYALLRRDLEHYQNHNLEFSTLILDEAQHIKNPDSQNAKAACALSAKSRFILTGTPLENSIRDLWSLYEFFLPGYLGSRKDFQERYETPLLNGERGVLWERLQRRTAPFLLRRRKKEILKDLPEKIEQTLYIQLTDEQKAAYFELQKLAQIQVEALQKQEGGAARMKVFTALLRLRQAACDLRLLGKTLPAEMASAKLTALSEVLAEAVDSEKRVLVFSQFTSMLDLISTALTEQALPFCRLDGSTRNREEVVSRFQNDSAIPVFLISLKAGGVGLNLTAADTVVLFDPWWNPAVEAQAIDRAHRLGQTQTVMALRLIAQDTVEERMQRLQEKKRILFQETVDSDAALSAFSQDDLAELIG